MSITLFNPHMRQFIYIATLVVGGLLSVSCHRQPAEQTETAARFLKIADRDIVTPDGEKFYIQGTNLGNWLNPEGYMFGFTKTNSPRAINDAFCQIIGTELKTMSATGVTEEI